MNATTLNLWGNGAVTLPKEWRDRYPTKNFLAIEDDSGNLVIKPIVEVEYYESEKGFGLKFPTGIEAGELLKLIKK